MGTRAIIGLQLVGDEQVTGMYSHCDGYLRQAGMGLVSHFTDIKRIRKLVSGGNVNCVHNDGNVSPWTGSYAAEPSVIYATRKDFIQSHYCYYVYIYLYDRKKKTGHWEYKYLLDDKECLQPFTRLFEKDCKE